MLIYIVIILKPDTESLSDIVDTDTSEKSGPKQRFLVNMQPTLRNNMNSMFQKRYIEDIRRMGRNDKNFLIRMGQSDNNLEFLGFHRMGRSGNGMPSRDRMDYLARLARPDSSVKVESGNQNRLQEGQETIPPWIQKLVMGFGN